MEANTVENDDIVEEDEPVQDITVEHVAEEDVAVTAEDVAVEVEETRHDNTSVSSVTSTKTSQKSGDGGIPKFYEDNPIAGPSNVRNVDIVILEKRVGLPRESKTKAYEYLKNIAKGHKAAATTEERRRVGRKRLKPTKRRNKSTSSRKRNKGKGGPNAKRFRGAVQDSATTITSGVTDVRRSSNVSSLITVTSFEGSNGSFE